jgi:uncharacterized protein (TIGR02391 family)
MAKRTETRPPTPPTISKEEGKRLLIAMRDRAKTLISSGRASDEITETWSNSTLDYIKHTFGSDSHYIHTFIGQIQVRMSGLGGGGFDQQRYEVQNAKEIQSRIAVLDQIIEQIDFEANLRPPCPTQTPQLDFWSLLHTDVVQLSKTRFDSGHFADSVEAAFKHINTKVKESVFRKANKELDGASLMTTAFSANSPIITLDNLSTESGRNVQLGYMQIFAGCMTGIRNPNAHGNTSIQPKEAMHLLFLASHLLFKLEGRL